MDSNRLPNYILDWTPKHGKRSAGRKRVTWMDCVEEDLALLTGRTGITHLQGKVLAINRKAWGLMLRKGKDIKIEQPNSLAQEE